MRQKWFHPSDFFTRTMFGYVLHRDLTPKSAETKTIKAFPREIYVRKARGNLWETVLSMNDVDAIVRGTADAGKRMLTYKRTAVTQDSTTAPPGDAKKRKNADALANVTCVGLGKKGHKAKGCAKAFCHPEILGGVPDQAGQGIV